MIRRLLGLLIVLLIAFGGGYLFYRTMIVGSTAPPPEIRTSAVRTASIEEKIVCLGEVEPELFTDVKSEVSGRVKAVHVVSGSEVTKGDVLVELDRSEMESELKEAEFGVESSRLKMEKAKIDFEAKEGLAGREFVSQRDLMDSKIDYELAQNDLNIQKAKVQTLNEKLAKMVIRAPHDGIVLDCAILEGMVISGATSFSEGTLLMQVAQLDQLRVNTDVNEIDVAKLRPGMTVTLTFDSLPEIDLEGRIVFVSPSAQAESERDSASNTAKVFPIIVTFSADDTRIRPGMTAKVNITLSTVENVLAAELPTLFLEEGEHVVYVKRGAAFDRRVVRTGISDHDVIEIKDGLEAGEELAMSKPPSEEDALPGSQTRGG